MPVGGRLREGLVQARDTVDHAVNAGDDQQQLTAFSLGAIVCRQQGMKLTRLGGPNFSQLPVNQPHCPVNDMLRDGMHQTTVPGGLAPCRPNSIDSGQPLVATAEEGGYVQAPLPG